MIEHAVPSTLPPQARPLRWRPHLVVLTRTPGHFDRLLLRLAESRDRTAFQELFAHFAPRVKAYVMRLGASDQAADDLAQEAMLAVWRKAALFDPARASASTWIFTIARNLRIDLMRREQQPKFDQDDPTMAPPQETGAEESVSARDRDEAVRVALAELPPEQGEIVRLSFYSGRPHGEIAKTLKIPLGTVKSRLRLAMARLRTALGETP